MPFGGCFSSFEQAFSSFWKPFGKVLKGEKSGSEQNRTFHFLGFCVHFPCFWSQNTCFLLSKSLIPPSDYMNRRELQMLLGEWRESLMVESAILYHEWCGYDARRERTRIILGNVVEYYGNYCIFVVKFHLYKICKQI